MILGLNLSHLVELESLHKEDFPLPNFVTNNLYFDRKGYFDRFSGKLQGAGLVKLTSEAMVILDAELSSFARAKILKALINRMKADLELAGIDGVHVFLQGKEVEKTKQFLSSFGFTEVKEPAMYLSLGGSNGKTT